MWALVQGLPPESATWRKSSLPPVEEFLALLIEGHGAWARAQIERTPGPKVDIPAPVRIRRPGEPEQPERKIESDPRRIAEFLSGRRG